MDWLGAVERDLRSVPPRPEDVEAELVCAYALGIAVATAILLGAWLLIERLTSAPARAIVSSPCGGE